MENLDPNSHSSELEAAPYGVPMRRCVVTEESFPRDTLLRFVASPEGQLVFDVKRNLPGRGIWVYPQKTHVEQAIEKKLFARGAKQAVKVPEDLLEKVEKALKRRVLSLLQRGLQSREMVNGFEKVSSALRSEETRLLVHANDASDDGVSKLNKLAAENVIIIQPCSREEMSEVLKIANPVHLSVRSAGLAKSIRHSYDVWAGFLQTDRL
ncbi:MAG: RNA-binding protein [Rickettsiales bacterium]|nr:RNA-binding protein [Rickettsiales bacterium]